MLIKEPVLSQFKDTAWFTTIIHFGFVFLVLVLSSFYLYQVLLGSWKPRPLIPACQLRFTYPQKNLDSHILVKFFEGLCVMQLICKKKKGI